MGRDVWRVGNTRLVSADDGPVEGCETCVVSYRNRGAVFEEKLDRESIALVSSPHEGSVT